MPVAKAPEFRRRALELVDQGRAGGPGGEEFGDQRVVLSRVKLSGRPVVGA